MTFVKLATAALFTSATALSAFAADDTISEKGKKMEDAAQVGAESTTVVDKDVYTRKGKTIVNMGVETRGSKDESVVDDVADNELSGAQRTEIENVLAIAEQNAEVWTASGEAIGTVAYTEDTGPDGHHVVVNVAPEAGLEADMLAFDAGSLKVVKTEDGLEYDTTMEYLRESVAKMVANRG